MQHPEIFYLKKKIIFMSNNDEYLMYFKLSNKSIEFGSILQRITEKTSLLRFSHIFFKDRLVKWSKNSNNGPNKTFENHQANMLKQEIVCYYWQQKQYQKLLVCGCFYENRRQKYLLNEPIYVNSYAYIKHIKEQHKGIIQPHSSHSSKYQINTSFTNFVYNQENHPNYTLQQFFNAITSKFSLSRYNFRYKSLLVQYPIINTFDLFCRNRTFDHIQQLNPLPFCKQCNRTIKNLKIFKQHCTKIHKTSNYKKFAMPFTPQIGLQYIQSQGIKFRQRFICVPNVSEDENLLLNLHLWLLKDIMICAECQTLFEDARQYAMHIYNAHQSISPLNTHSFRFLLSKQQAIQAARTIND